MAKLNSALGIIALLTATLTATWPAAAQDIKSSLVGIWKLTSHANKNATTGAVTHPFGQHPQGYQVFGKGGLMMFTMFAEGRKTPAGPSPTDPERADLLRTMVSYVGTYSVTGSRVTVRIDANATPTDVSDRVYIAEQTGNKLLLTAEPLRNEAGQQQVTIRTFDRVE